MPNTLAGPTLPYPRQPPGVTVVMTGGVTLFVLFGSPSGVLTLAGVGQRAAAGAVTVTVTLLTWPLASVPNVQFTTPLLLAPPPLALTNVTPSGNVSVTVTLLALAVQSSSLKSCKPDCWRQRRMLNPFLPIATSPPALRR